MTHLHGITRCFLLQVDSQQKLLVGDLGAMEKMLSVIKDGVQNGEP